MYELALVDGALADSETNTLKRVADAFNLSPDQLREIHDLHLGRQEVLDPLALTPGRDGLPASRPRGRAAGLGLLASGLASGTFGAAFTAVSYSAASPGGIYVVAAGALGTGLILTVVGLVMAITGWSMGELFSQRSPGRNALAVFAIGAVLLAFGIGFHIPYTDSWDKAALLGGGGLILLSPFVLLAK